MAADSGGIDKYGYDRIAAVSALKVRDCRSKAAGVTASLFASISQSC
jgi:hypothetical protein